MTPVEKLNQDLSKLVHAIRYVSFAFGKRSLDESLQNEAGKSILTTKVDFALVYKVVKNTTKTYAKTKSTSLNHMVQKELAMTPFPRFDAA